LLTCLEQAILDRAGGIVRLQVEFGRLLRTAIDAVIDSRQTGRLTYAELEKTEKTYIGTKVEILFRNLIKAEKGQLLDLSIEGVEVDIKNTMGRAWTIPPEAIDHPCILIRPNESTARCNLGLVVVRETILNPGRNRDGKRTISLAAQGSIRWLLRDAVYPKNFWQFLDQTSRNEIMSARGGTSRMVMLFRKVQRTPISRTVIESVAQQKDSLKRLRKNGGARDKLSRDNIVVLWGRNDRQLIEDLGLPLCSSNEFISISPRNEDERQRLIEAGHLTAEAGFVTDSLTTPGRSENMRRIRSANTLPEKTVRSIAHRLGFRFRLHVPDLPGKPDLVFPRLGRIIQVHGCFWHLHAKCREGRVPDSRRDYWERKLLRNVARDQKNAQRLRRLGWRVLTVWECETKNLDTLVSRIDRFLSGSG